jgi:hypothetical protein
MMGWQGKFTPPCHRSGSVPVRLADYTPINALLIQFDFNNHFLLSLLSLRSHKYKWIIMGCQSILKMENADELGEKAHMEIAAVLGREV